jgi:hypothetical protein
MKITADHFEVMKNAITPMDTAHHREMYRMGKFARADKVKNLDERYRWDLMWASGASHLVNFGEYQSSHIDTALRKIVPLIEGPTYLEAPME